MPKRGQRQPYKVKFHFDHPVGRPDGKPIDGTHPCFSHDEAKMFATGILRRGGTVDLFHKDPATGKVTPLPTPELTPDDKDGESPMTDEQPATLRTGPTPDAPEGYAYRPAPADVQAIMQRRFEDDGITAIDPDRPHYLRHDVGDFWNGSRAVRDNGDGTYTYRNPYTGDEDTFSAATLGMTGTGLLLTAIREFLDQADGQLDAANRCPTCHAKTGDHCRNTRNGLPIVGTHPNRAHGLLDGLRAQRTRALELLAQVLNGAPDGNS